MKLYSRGALDPRWVEHHVPVVTSFMLATVNVIRKLPSTQAVRPTYDPATKTWDTTGSVEPVVTGVKARIQPFGIMSDVVNGQDTTGRRLMRVQIESKTAGIRIDDIIVITDVPDAPELVKYQLEVRGTIGSSNSWVGDYICETSLKAEL